MADRVLKLDYESSAQSMNVIVKELEKITNESKKLKTTVEAIQKSTNMAFISALVKGVESVSETMSNLVECCENVKEGVRTYTGDMAEYENQSFHLNA